MPHFVDKNTKYIALCINAKIHIYLQFNWNKLLNTYLHKRHPKIQTPTTSKAFTRRTLKYYHSLWCASQSSAPKLIIPRWLCNFSVLYISMQAQISYFPNNLKPIKYTPRITVSLRFSRSYKCLSTSLSSFCHGDFASNTMAQSI